MAAFYPVRAHDLGVEGQVSFQCVVNLDETLSNCSIVNEDPPGYGFGEATLKLTHLFRVRPAIINGQPVADSVFRRTIHWQLGNGPPCCGPIH